MLERRLDQTLSLAEVVEAKKVWGCWRWWGWTVLLFPLFELGRESSWPTFFEER